MQKLYVIQSGESGPVKIGIAKFPDIRLADLQTANPDRLHLRAVFKTPHARALESDIHSELRNHRLLGEWFDVTPERVAELAASFGAIHKRIARQQSARKRSEAEVAAQYRLKMWLNREAAEDAEEIQREDETGQLDQLLWDIGARTIYGDGKPISKAEHWRGIRNGTFAKPVALRTYPIVFRWWESEVMAAARKAVQP